MLVPTFFPSKLQHQDQELQKEFSMLVWNIHKENQQQGFIDYLETLLQSYPSDFLLFQEVKHPKTERYTLNNYSYALASNIETSKNIFGVATAAKVSFESINTHISSIKDMIGLATHKSMLITEHLLHDKTALFLVNLHAINFVTLKSFTIEFEKITQILSLYQGAIIVGGDFNTWSKRRLKLLEDFQNDLALQKAVIHAPHHVKALFSKPLDHLFYRGITLQHAEALDTKNISDHNPIYAKFQVVDV